MRRRRCALRASVFLAAFGALVSMSGCAAYPAGGYGGVGYGWPDYGPGYAYSPGFGYSDYGLIGLGVGDEHHRRHFDSDFDRRHFDHGFRADRHFHGPGMTGEPERARAFHSPPGDFRGPGLHREFGAGGGFHPHAPSPPPAPHAGGVSRLLQP